MFIKTIKLKNFRNYDYQEIQLDKGVNIFIGDNAQGKTNILESVFLCSMGKSFRAKKDKELVKIGKEECFIEIEYEKSDRKGRIAFNITDKKSIFLNDIKIKKLSELLGNINIVMFSPDDIEILKDGPIKRRRFLNMMISQLRPNYTHVYNLYTKVLEQRNNYLRQIKIEGKDENFLDIWDEKLAEYGEVIYRYRYEFVEKIKEKLLVIHRKITEGNEEIDIKYLSDFYIKENFLKKLKENRRKDIQKGYTTSGVHRDDFEIYINDKKVNIYGSQGQHRTAMLSLKLSELYVIYDDIGEYPILLLDDFMSELDEKRRRNFVRNITEAQVLITGTHEILLENLKYNVYNVQRGKVNKK